MYFKKRIPHIPIRHFKTKIKKTETNKILNNKNSYKETIKQLKKFIKILKIVTENHTIDCFGTNNNLNNDKIDTPDLLLRTFKSALENLTNKKNLEQDFSDTKNEFYNWYNNEKENK